MNEYAKGISSQGEKDAKQWRVKKGYHGKPPFFCAARPSELLGSAQLRFYDAIKVGLFFGVFQFLMPCIGNLVSGFATDIVERFDHWIAFVLLGFLGLHMIWESRTEQEIPKNPLKNSSLLLAAIATSIDALAAGVTLAAVDTPILFSSAVIGITAFLFSFGGVFIGKKFGGFLGSKAECIGGIILILIGIKTLVEHLY